MPGGQGLSKADSTYARLCQSEQLSQLLPSPFKWHCDPLSPYTWLPPSPLPSIPGVQVNFSRCLILQQFPMLAAHPHYYAVNASLFLLQVLGQESGCTGCSRKEHEHSSWHTNFHFCSQEHIRLPTACVCVYLFSFLSFFLWHLLSLLFKNNLKQCPNSQQLCRLTIIIII